MAFDTPFLYERFADTYEVVVRLIEVTPNLKFVKVAFSDKLEGAFKEEFKAGQAVYCYIEYQNIGSGAGGPRIIITDLDTGEELLRVGGEIINPGESAFTWFKLGTMPNRDWRLRFVLEDIPYQPPY